MPELRRDPITHRWTIIASERALRPKALRVDATPPPHRTCPFCPGFEGLTPPEIHANRSQGPANGKGWSTRVIPNKFPALRIEGGLDKQPDGIYDRMGGVGAHEVIIESPDHTFTLQALPLPHLTDALQVYRDRMLDLRRDSRFQHSLLFRNHGAAAGATIAHGHAQLIALPIVPDEVQVLLDGSKRYFDFHARNVFEDIIWQETEDGRRLVYTNSDYVLVCPYASRQPFELWIIPRFHATHFEHTTRAQLASLAEILKVALTRLDVGLENPAYNFILQSAPYSLDQVPWYRWHIQIMPKLVQTAGFEWGTGFHINPTAPEEAAEFLRGVTI